MQRYKNLSGDSGVVAYKIGRDYIDIQFKDGGTYRYDYRTPGQQDVETMKQLAQQGADLATYINKFVRERFASKLS
jgi:hypothetical protein